MKHIHSTSQFTRPELDNIFKRADMFLNKEYPSPVEGFKEKVMATLFYEPSTRTRLSFESAMLRLGGNVISVENARESSSDKKGESLKSTLKTVSQLADVIILRQSKEKPDIGNPGCHIINAGDGINEHPTQALLDLYTILKHHEDKKLRIMFTGDLAHSRTIRSLLPLLKLYYDVNIFFGNQHHNFDDIEDLFVTVKEEFVHEALPIVDVLYMTRNQTERHNENKTNFRMTPELANNAMKKNAIIMHPLPYTNEIDEALDENHRAFYYKQVFYGMYVRMGLLYWLL